MRGAATSPGGTSRSALRQENLTLKKRRSQSLGGHRREVRPAASDPQTGKTPSPSPRQAPSPNGEATGAAHSRAPRLLPPTHLPPTPGEDAHGRVSRSVAPPEAGAKLAG